MIQPVAESLQDSIEYFRLRGDLQNSKDMLKILNDGLKHIETLLLLKPFSFPTKYDNRYNAKHA
jgi:hypothetical protein